MDTSYVAEHLLCTAEEKNSCLKTAYLLLILNDVARREGLLALENRSQDDAFAAPPLLRVGILLLLDGTDPAITEEILTNYIISSNLSNRDFLDNMLVSSGLLSIQQGENPDTLREKLRSLFGLDFIGQFDESMNQRFMQSDIPCAPELEDALERYGEKLDSFPKTSVLEDILPYLNDFCIQCLVRNVSDSVLVPVLAASSQKVIKKFLSNMGKQRKQRFWKDIGSFEALNLSYVESAWKEMSDIIRDLSQKGEIFLFPWDCETFGQVSGRLNQEEISQLLSRADSMDG